MKIHPVTHAKGDKNRFCGPAALSILIGMNTGEAARLLRHVSGKQAVMGTASRHVARALTMCGLTVTDLHMKLRRVPDPKWSQGYRMEHPTLAQWLRETVKERTAGRVFLLVARNHWQVISGRRYCCGQTGGIISTADKGCRKRARVTEVYEITAKDRITVPAIARKPSAASRINPTRKQLLVVEREHGFKGKIEREGGYVDYVVPACTAFPRGFSTLHHGWDETLGRVLPCLDPEVYANHADEDGHVSF